ncbi:DUF4124 domain-containing protein [Aromatoleum diolicum]|uniref:DUF4124 domain-containing protein n=1 Tax=Aromatoleum diolicum TaxID=75796 RepID=A0ABX1QFF5_9RHOO|nr:DUF4124 domain-containing protein [Aromatoleum diolicum]NMG76678.1 DUF4124 domain-containing protein [Aromatoleum diolicum]
MRRASLLALSLIITLPAAAEVYQWRDAQGRINYSDTPPAAENAKKLRGAARPVTPAAPEEDASQAGTTDANGITPDAAKADAAKTDGTKADPSKPKTIAEKEVEFRQRRAATAEAEAKAEKERQQADERARSCEQARGQLVALQSGQRLSRYNSKGERELVDDAGRRAEIERTQKYIDATCK